MFACWQVIGIFAGFGLLLLIASPFLLFVAPCILCCKCKRCQCFGDDAAAATQAGWCLVLCHKHTVLVAVIMWNAHNVICFYICITDQCWELDAFNVQLIGLTSVHMFITLRKTFIVHICTKIDRLCITGKKQVYKVSFQCSTKCKMGGDGA